MIGLRNFLQEVYAYPIDFAKLSEDGYKIRFIDSKEEYGSNLNRR